ncbi:zona pellucida-like domain-containing protein 1 [Polyodon spathula]|uniref:zona pellucida-like domain-containing protein 1 n=1 Tax=Polyodon spathula TaxID=7913 RepID=UPI001B7E855C|nr:zona pellucida-like domain-containing protein 1 [Polyodon spathula]
MMGFLFSLLFALTLLRESQGLTIADCGDSYRRPEKTDIFVTCGASTIDLAIFVCPVMFSGYNESLLALNSRFQDPSCKGTLDATVTPPLLRFQFPINENSSCGSVFKITSAMGTGIFQDFSNIQTINISGIIRTTDPSVGIVTYNEDLVYLYSCTYPLEYLINNTKIDVSGSSIAMKDNNGSFISTLSLQLFKDVNYTSALQIPPTGLVLKTNIYVQVKATNLTSRFNVLLDRCYASTSQFPSNSTYFDLFVTCSGDKRTTIIVNGDTQYARFSFPAFRFTEQQNLTVSTYYLHCITRLCDSSFCKDFKQCGKRRRRDVEATPSPTVLTEPTTISSGPIITSTESVLSKEEGHWNSPRASARGHEECDCTRARPLLGPIP